MSEAEAAREPKIIKRYTNRKLYDTVESRYVTLDEIAEMVKQGAEVKIIDNRTKEDLTNVTLAQIVFEEEKKQKQMPLSVLREIIRQPGERINQFINTQVNPRVDAIREQTTTRINTLLGREPNEDLSPAALAAQSQKVFETWQARVDERVKHAIENVVGNLPALGRDLSTLMTRLDALEAKLKALEEAQPAPKSKKK